MAENGVRCSESSVRCSMCCCTLVLFEISNGLFCSMLDVLFSVLFDVLFDVLFCRPFEVWRFDHCFVRHTHRSVRGCVGSDVLFDVVFADDIPHAGYFAVVYSMFCSMICVGLVCETFYCSSLYSNLCSDFLFCSMFCSTSKVNVLFDVRETVEQ